MDSNRTRALRVLSVSPAPEDHAAVLRILADSRWRLACARSCREAIGRIRRDGISLVICERILPDGDWKDLLSRLSGWPASPPLIVASSLADDRLWAEVLNLGGYDVLAKPFVETEVRRVVESAWDSVVRDLSNSAMLAGRTASARPGMFPVTSAG